MPAPILITGSAGFIGFHLAKRLLDAGESVIGVDNLNAYYDQNLKQARLDALDALKNPKFQFEKLDLTDATALTAHFTKTHPKIVIHLAAQAGVRHSIDNPAAYADSNLMGFFHILEACRHHDISHLIYASSSAVYGGSKETTFSEKQPTDTPISFYAATKKANEAMAHAYAHLYGLPCTGLRFFTVYGPWGRPDMAYWRFCARIMQQKPIPIYGEGKLSRDFTYIDDIIDGIMPLIKLPPKRTAEDLAPNRILNIGNNHPIQLKDFITALEDAIGIKAEKHFLPMQAGDMPHTQADITALHNLTGFKPKWHINEGLNEFVKWYRHWHGNA